MVHINALYSQRPMPFLGQIPCVSDTELDWESTHLLYYNFNPKETQSVDSGDYYIVVWLLRFFSYHISVCARRHAEYEQRIFRFCSSRTRAFNIKN